MPASSLSVAGSEIFKERLADLRQKNAWSYSKVGAVLGCTRSTAINLLREGNRTRVRASYAKRLEEHIDGEVPWSAATRNDSAIKNLLTEWAAADVPPKRRRMAGRLMAFLTEYLVSSYRLCVTSSIETSALSNPVSALFTIKNSGSNLRHDLMFVFDLRDRTRLPMMLYNNENERIFNGYLSRSTLNNLLTRVKSCH
jgi:hypothetical protein